MSVTPHIASQLDKLPLELIEPIISRLTFRDAIALTNQVDQGSHLWNAFSISPTWKGVWPMIVANRDQFEILTDLMITVNGRIFDLTDGVLDGPPGKFLRQVAREQARQFELNVDYNDQVFGTGFLGFNFLEYAALKASQTLVRVISGIDDNVLSFICQELPVDLIATLAPWLSKDNPSEAELRQSFIENLQSSCLCGTYRARPVPRTRHYPWLVERNPKDTPVDEWVRQCRKKHPTRPTAHWSIPETKAFAVAYSEVQKKLNATKADQLRDMSKIYRRHHSRLKMPLAPQTPRKNPTHIPEQLGVTAKYVERIIDLCRSPAFYDGSTKQRGRTQGVCRFMYPHACLIPYDWCLRLWMRVVEGIDAGADAASHATEHIRQHIEVVKKGMAVYYGKVKDGELGGALAYDDKIFAEGFSRTKIRQVDGTPAFAVHHEEAHELGKTGRGTILFPAKTEEVEWLAAFLETVEWIEGEYPELAAEIKAAGGDLEQDVDVEEWVCGKKGKRKRNDGQTQESRRGLVIRRGGGNQ
ncbi:hypothetical protein QBC44DRAFT_332525 [Cladorrhinum sp. PSN332]|nr:hypothetical protein QBC44DRAFT_332525 [Cladorrhinum sp. PSN332]